MNNFTVAQKQALVERLTKVKSELQAKISSFSSSISATYNNITQSISELIESLKSKSTEDIEIIEFNETTEENNNKEKMINEKSLNEALRNTGALSLSIYNELSSYIGRSLPESEVIEVQQILDYYFSLISPSNYKKTAPKIYNIVDEEKIQL